MLVSGIPMPDLITHYVVSLFISSRVTKFKYSLLLALVGLLPDLDVLFRVHRWFTHSIVVAITVFTLLFLIVYIINRRFLKYVVLSASLYFLHIIIDIFIASTPLLWPLTDKGYKLAIELNSVLSMDRISIEPNVVLIVKNIDFNVKHHIEGPIISTEGTLITIIILIIFLLENLFKKYL